MNFGSCVHCEHPIRDGGIYVYTKSRVRAHLSCVSQPSAAKMDELLLITPREPRRK